MLLLHASVLGDGLVLWGEQPTDAPLLRRPGRRPLVALSPFDPGVKRLRKGLRSALPDVTAGARPLVALAWLPATSSGPLPSSPLIDPTPPRGRVTLGAFRVEALRLTPARWLDLLAAAVGRDTMAPGIVIGPTLAFWAAALRFAAALVARQQVVPGLRRSATGWRACWQPVIAGADVVRAAALTRAMPPACRALSTGATLTPPEIPAQAALDTFLDASVDALVRSAARTATFTTPVPQVRRSTLPSLHDQWAHALSAANSTLTAPLADLERLERQVRDWRRPLATTAAPYRLCFRLEEPPLLEGPEPPPGTDLRPWHLRYLIQAADDPQPAGAVGRPVAEAEGPTSCCCAWRRGHAASSPWPPSVRPPPWTRISPPV